MILIMECDVQRFDLIDIVVLEGDPNVLPWERKNSRIKHLFQMCKATNKTLFACGIGMQLLVHFCAIGEQQIKVINGAEKGGLLETISQYKSAEVLSQLDQSTVFLDYATGDFYCFDINECQWKPNGNVGMHYSKALDFVPGGREIVRKPTVHRSETLNGNLFLQKVTDVKAHVDKIHQSNFLFKGIQSEFVVDASNQWDPHPVQTMDLHIVKENYTVMAES